IIELVRVVNRQVRERWSNSATARSCSNNSVESAGAITLHVRVEVRLELFEGVRKLRCLDVDTRLLAAIARPLRLGSNFAGFRKGNRQKKLRCVSRASTTAHVAAIGVELQVSGTGLDTHRNAQRRAARWVERRAGRSTRRGRHRQ